MWNNEMTIGVEPGDVATIAASPAFLCGLAGRAPGQYTGRSFEPRRAAEAA